MILRSTLLKLLFVSVLSISITAFATGGEKGSKTDSKSGNLVANDSQKSASAGILYFDDLDGANDTSSLMARGYYFYHRGGGPQGTTALWYQGIPTVFPSYSGPDTGYVAANYNVVTDANDIDTWLVLPALNVTQGDTISFVSRSPDGSNYPDSIRVMYSAAGDILPEAASWVELGRFKVSTAGWEYNEFYATSAGTTGRFAIRYAVANGGPLGTNSNYIGIDDIMVTGALGTGIKEISKVDFSISPNPAREFLNISVTEFAGSQVYINIINVLGQQIFEEVISVPGDNYAKKIDVSTLDKGVYFITLKTENHATTKKLVVE